VIHHRKAFIPKCTRRTGSGRHSYRDIPEHNDVLTNTSSTIRVGDTLVPMIFMSDGTHLLNFARDHKEWPVSMTIDTLSLMLRQMPSTHNVVIVALLPIPIKNHNFPQKPLDEQRNTNQEVLNAVLRQVQHLVTSKYNPSAESRYYNVLCAVGNIRRCTTGFSTMAYRLR
jgi:hypothetical protein